MMPVHACALVHLTSHSAPSKIPASLCLRVCHRSRRSIAHHRIKPREHQRADADAGPARSGRDFQRADRRSSACGAIAARPPSDGGVCAVRVWSLPERGAPVLVWSPGRGAAGCDRLAMACCSGVRAGVRALERFRQRACVCVRSQFCVLCALPVWTTRLDYPFGLFCGML